MTDIAVRAEYPAPTVLSNEQLQYIAKTEFVPTGLRGNLPAILACVATGRALGLDDMTAIRSIHIIEGKATFSAELMVQLVRRAGHSITGEVTDGAATVTGKRADNGDTMTATWTRAMAERAGLLNKGNWKKYPEAMLWARAVSQLCRMLFADCFAGATYTTEELGADNTDNTGVPYEEEDRLFPPLSAAAGGALKESDAGAVTPEPHPVSDGAPGDGVAGASGSLSALTARLIAFYPGEEDLVRHYVAKHAAEHDEETHLGWLADKIAAKTAEAQTQFEIPEAARS